MENVPKKYFVIDAGNTSLKAALFQNNTLIEVTKIDYKSEDFWKRLHSFKNQQLILSSVVELQLEQQLIEFLTPTIVLSYKTPVPIDVSSYQTINTLGVDRLANAVAGAYFAKETHALIIDVGTCVKYDLVNAKKEYLGGIISPGIAMRFKAMHTFTGKLPLIEQVKPVNLIGDSTNSCMTSGVLNGLLSEIEGVIDKFEQKFENLTIFLTGGDRKMFDKALKNTIFVNENLTLWGLYLILKHNAA